MFAFVLGVVLAVVAGARGRLFRARVRGAGRPRPGEAEALVELCSFATWRSLAMRWVIALGVTSARWVSPLVERKRKACEMEVEFLQELRKVG